MVRFNWLTRRLLLGLVVGVLLLGGSLIDSRGALAGVGGSPGSRVASSTLIKGCTTGEHIKEVKIELTA